MKNLIIILIVAVIVLIVCVSKLYLLRSQDEETVRSFANSNTIVYIVGTPRPNLLYHTATCRELQTTRYKIYYLDLTTASNMGLDPCPECDPPKPSLSKREMKQVIKMRNEAKVQEDMEREQAGRDFLLNGKKSPKYIQSKEFIPAKPNQIEKK